MGSGMGAGMGFESPGRMEFGGEAPEGMGSCLRVGDDEFGNPFDPESIGTDDPGAIIVPLSLGDPKITWPS